jgi:hypothetical protein
MRPFGKPVCLSFILCEAVVRDLDSGRQAIVGTLDHLFTEGCPAGGKVLTAFLEVTGLVGHVHLEIRLLRADEFRTSLPPRGVDVLATWPIPARFAPSEADVITVAPGLGGAVFPEFGDYWFVLYLNGSPLLARRLGVRARSEP